MRKTLILFGLFGLCLASSDLPPSEEYTEAKVDNPRVLEQANYILAESAKNFRLGCDGAVLVEVTRAQHKLSYRFPYYGAYYEIEMTLKTKNGDLIPCKARIWSNIRLYWPKGLYHYCDCTVTTA
ncbi:hypothetical protein CHS0354_018105 [Potamilus streckersoni]|uniref:Uncharacterized protein n=1 Tax=Potamilus streckersoni TaxID=2493646 RepID=A0AAE0TJL8_9BIVA|nr:hypothetical protein CHS0354_018105 [Potamilus streckersoni]